MKDWKMVTKDAVPHAFPSLPLCVGNCGLAADLGDIFCSGCREGFNRDPSFITEVYPVDET